MLLQCNNCGAPLDGRAAKASIKCNYCGAVHVKEALPVQQPVVPQGWQPPRTWVAPANYAVAGQSLAYQRTMRGISAIIWISVLVPVLGAIGGVTASVRAASDGLRAPWAAPAASWDGTSTLLCGGNDQVSIAGVHARRLTSVVEATGNCKLEIHGAQLEVDGPSGTGIVASGNAEVDIYDSTMVVTGGRDSTRAIDASGNAKVRVHAGRIAGRYKLRATDSALVNILYAKVHGPIDTSMSGKVVGVEDAPKDGQNADPGGRGKGEGHGCGCAKGDKACHKRCRKNR